MNREPFNQDVFNKALDSMLIAKIGILSLTTSNQRIGVSFEEDKQIAQATMDDVWASTLFNNQVGNLGEIGMQAVLMDDISILNYLAEAMHYIRNEEVAAKPTNPLTVWVIYYLELSKKMWMAMGRREAQNDFSDTYIDAHDPN